MFHHVSPRFTPWELRQTPPVGWRRRPWRVARISRCSATQRRPLRPGSPWPRRRTATKMEGEQLWFHMGRRHGNHMGWVKTYYYHIGGINLLLTSYFKVPMVPGFWGIATWKTLSKRWAKYEKTWKIWQKMVTTWNGLLFCFKKTPDDLVQVPAAKVPSWSCGSFLPRSLPAVGSTWNPDRVREILLFVRSRQKSHYLGSQAR